MAYLQEHRKFRHKLHSPILATALLVTFLIIGNSTWEVYKKDRVARINREDSEKRLTDLTARKNYLTNQLRGLGTERGIEGELRSKYQITKEGEQELVIVDIVDTISKDNLSDNGKNKSLLENLLENFF